MSPPPIAPSVRDIRPLRDAADPAHATAIASWLAHVDTLTAIPPSPARLASEASALAAERAILGAYRVPIW